MKSDRIISITLNLTLDDGGITTSGMGVRFGGFLGRKIGRVLI